MTKILLPALLCASLWACADKKQQPPENDILKKIATLERDEVSGLQYVNGTLWAHEDSGNKNKLYKTDPHTGKDEGVTIAGVENTDWEDITADKEGNLYIGDMGNNDNDRRDLAIYRVDAANPGKVAYTVSFYYPEQKAFPPKRGERNFDCEAFLNITAFFTSLAKTGVYRVMARCWYISLKTVKATILLFRQAVLLPAAALGNVL